jgi:hypothetical protein
VIVKTEIARFDGLFQRADFCGDSRFSGNHLTLKRVEALIETSVHAVEAVIDTSVHASEKPPQVLERRILIRHDSATSLASIGLSRTASAVPGVGLQIARDFGTIDAVCQRRLADTPPRQCAAARGAALRLGTASKGDAAFVLLRRITAMLWKLTRG